MFFALFAMSITDKIFSCLFSSAAGCIMCLALEQAMECMPISLLNPVLALMEKLDFCVVQGQDLQPGSKQCIEPCR